MVLATAGEVGKAAGSIGAAVFSDAVVLELVPVVAHVFV